MARDRSNPASAQHVREAGYACKDRWVPRMLAVVVLILDTVKGQVPSTSGQQTESKIDANDPR